MHHRSRRPERLAGVRHADLGDGDRGYPVLHQGGRRILPGGVLHEAVPVHDLAGNGHEQEPSPGLAAVVGDVLQPDRPVPAQFPSEARGQAGEGNRPIRHPDEPPSGGANLP